MDAGTFQGGLKTTASICEANIGVGCLGLPTITRMRNGVVPGR